jgi:hypothetical protein
MKTLSNESSERKVGSSVQHRDDDDEDGVLRAEQHGRQRTELPREFNRQTLNVSDIKLDKRGRVTTKMLERVCNAWYAHTHKHHISKANAQTHTHSHTHAHKDIHTHLRKHTSNSFYLLRQLMYSCCCCFGDGGAYSSKDLRHTHENFCREYETEEENRKLRYLSVNIVDPFYCCFLNASHCKM